MGEPPGRLTGKVCVIAGAGGEIAEAVAARLASEDATVVGIDRELLVTSFECLSADLTDEKQSRRVFEALAATYGRIHVLYNDAGPIDRDDHSPLTTSTEGQPRLGQHYHQPGSGCSGRTSHRRSWPASTASR